MKKILAIALALAMTLSLCAIVSVADGSVYVAPGVDPSSPAVSKYTYSATTSSGARVNATVAVEESGIVYDEVVAGGVVGLYNISIGGNVGPDEIVNVDVYAPGVTADCVVIVRDGWEVLDNVTFTVNGNRAIISAPAGILNQYHYVAIVKDPSKVIDDYVDVNTPKEPGDQDSQEEVDEGDDITVNDTDDEETKDENPKTGIALAVVPMIVAAAAIVVSKKR